MAEPRTSKNDQPARLGWQGAIGSAGLLGLSIVFMVGGLQLGLGSPFRLGTGAFPFLSGLLLAILSALNLILDVRGAQLSETPDWMGFLAISGALAVFALTAERLGLMPAAFLTTFVASLPDRSLPLPQKAVLGVAVAVGSWLLFIEALNLPFKPFVGL